MAASPRIQPNPVLAPGLDPHPSPPTLGLGEIGGWDGEWLPDCVLPLRRWPEKCWCVFLKFLLSCTLFTCCTGCNPAASLLGCIKVCGHKSRQRSKGQVFQVMVDEQPLVIKFYFFSNDFNFGQLLCMLDCWGGQTKKFAFFYLFFFFYCSCILQRENGRLFLTKAWADIIKHNTQQGT